MEIELLEIRDFLADRPPFDGLPAAQLDALPRQVKIRYQRRGQPFPPADIPGEHLYVVRSGAIACYNPDGQLINKLAEGALYTEDCQLIAANLRNHAETLEDSLLYLLPCERIKQLRDAHPDFARYLSESLRPRLQQAAVAGNHSTLASLALPISRLPHRVPLRITADCSIRHAAERMTEQGSTAALIMDGETLVGLLTDKDIRSRCVATGMDANLAVANIMTSAPHTISPQTLIVDALNVMSRLHIHHLPVTDNNAVTGLVSATDLTRYQSGNSAFLTAEILQAQSITELAEICARLPQLQCQLAQAGTNAQQIGDAVSAVTDGLTQRLIALAEDDLGPPPINYAWLAGGSQARREQTSHTDQDNALLLAEDYDPDRHGDYFKQLAQQVSDGLNACGFVYCPGNAMASNPDWRQPLSGWQRHFDRWIDTPEPKALMHASIFFDLRVVQGDKGLFRQLQQHVLPRCQKNHIFIAHLAANALTHRPPLGFFRTFVLIHDGQHDDTLDLKHRGIVPITDIARLLALAAGISAVNTRERLIACRDNGALSQEMADNLLDALAFIALLRIRHQANQIQQGGSADNFIRPTDLSVLEREYLKDAFKVIRSLQETLEMRYQTGRLQ